MSINFCEIFYKNSWWYYVENFFFFYIIFIISGYCFIDNGDIISDCNMINLNQPVKTIRRWICMVFFPWLNCFNVQWTKPSYSNLSKEHISPDSLRGGTFILNPKRRECCYNYVCFLFHLLLTAFRPEILAIWLKNDQRNFFVAY